MPSCGLADTLLDVGDAAAAPMSTMSCLQAIRAHPDVHVLEGRGLALFGLGAQLRPWDFCPCAQVCNEIRFGPAAL